MNIPLTEIQKFQKELWASHWIFMKKTATWEYALFGVGMGGVGMGVWRSMGLTDEWIVVPWLASVFVILMLPALMMRWLHKTSMLVEFLEYLKIRGWEKKHGVEWEKAARLIKRLSIEEEEIFLGRVHEHGWADRAEFKQMWQEKVELGYWAQKHADQIQAWMVEKAKKTVVSLEQGLGEQMSKNALEPMAVPVLKSPIKLLKT